MKSALLVAALVLLSGCTSPSTGGIIAPRTENTATPAPLPITGQLINTPVSAADLDAENPATPAPLPITGQLINTPVSAVDLDAGYQPRCAGDVCVKVARVDGPETTLTGNATLLNSLRNDVPYPRLAALAYTNSSAARSCAFVFSAGQRKFVEERSYVFGELCELPWNDSIVGSRLYKNYTLVFYPYKDFVAARYLGDGVLEISLLAARDTGLKQYLLHEIVHSAVEGLGLPLWFEEGLAEYLSHRWTGQFNTVSYYRNIALWDPRNSSYTVNARAYPTAGYIMRRLVERFGEGVIRSILADMDTEGNPDNTGEERNQKLFAALRNAAGNQTITEEEILHPS